MNIRCEDAERRTIVYLEGEVDMRSSPELRAGLREVTDRKVPQVVVNLEEVRYIDSSGIATLVECLKHVSEYQGKLLIVGAGEDIYAVFELAHLTSVFDLRRDTKLD
jgi:anti-sigma B factor antagonist